MQFLSQILPIIIYILLIIFIIVGIILGIKLIFTIEKINKLIDDVNNKIEKVTPLFNAVGFVSNKMNNVFGLVSNKVEFAINKLFSKKKNERKNEDYE